MCDINKNFIKWAQENENELYLAKNALKCGANIHFNNDAALLSSVKNENLEMITLLLNNGADINVPHSIIVESSNDGHNTFYYDFELSALTWAVYNGCTNVVKILLGHNTNTNANAQIINKLALRIGAHKGHTEIVTLLLENGSNIHTNRDAALRYSVNSEHIKTVVVLLKAGANVNVQHGIPLRSSVAKGNLVLVAKLLKYGANIHCNDDAILKNLQENFNEAMADTLLPYCDEEDYHHFPNEYIRTKIISTKSATSM